MALNSDSSKNEPNGSGKKFSDGEDGELEGEASDGSPPSSSS